MATSARPPRPVCTFFLQNRCTKGVQCLFSHDRSLASAAGGRGGNLEVTPSRAVAANRGPGSIPTPCKFFQQGYCSRGAACFFQHVPADPPELAAPTGSGFGLEEREKINMLGRRPEESTPTATKVMGATLSVTFGPGLEVSSITSATTTSIITIHNLPVGTCADTVRQLIATASPTEAALLALDAVRVIHIEESTYATAKLPDMTTAEAVVRALHGKLYGDEHQLSVKLYQPQGLSNTSQSATRVVCTWFAPSKVASVKFRTYAGARSMVSSCNRQAAVAAAGERVERGRRAGRRVEAKPMIIKRRKIECKLCSDGDREVSIGNLAISTTRRDLNRVIPESEIQTVYFHEPNHSLSPMAAMEFIITELEKDNLDRDGLKKKGKEVQDEVEGYEIRPESNHKSKNKAIIRFTTAAAAAKAVRNLNGRKMAFLGNTPLFLQPIFTANFKIAPEIHRVVSSDLAALAAKHEEAVRLKVFGGRGGGSSLVTVRLTAQKMADLAAVKALVGSIVRGQLCRRGATAKDGRVGGAAPLWDPFFATILGIQRITQIGHETKTYIYADRRKSQVFLFGTAENRQKATQMLRQLLDELLQPPSLSSSPSAGKDTVHEVPIERTAWRYFIRDGLLRQLQDRFGRENINVNIVSRSINFRGTLQELEEMRILARLATAEDKPSSREWVVGIGECPICFDTPEKPSRFSSSCNDIYCASCLADYITSATDTRKFPITCVGTARDGSGSSNHLCNCSLELQYATAVLSPADLDAVFASSFTDYIRRRPKEYAYCPTPNCSTVYTPTTATAAAFGSGGVLGCVECQLEICTSCHVEAHEGMTCAEFQCSRRIEDREAEEQANEARFSEWKARAGVKICPKCAAHIEKTDGCNHITCAYCKAHICWECLKVFAMDGDVYLHMNQKHGGIGL